MNPNVLKWVLAVYLCVSVSCVWLLWRNLGAPDAAKDTLTLASTLLVGVLAVLPYLSPQRWENYFTIAFLYDRHANTISFGDSVRTPYFYRMGRLLSGFKGEDLLVERPDDRYTIALAALEAGIFQTLSMQYMIGWNYTNTKKLAMPLGTTETFQLNMNAGKVEISNQKLLELLAQNRFKHTLLASSRNPSDTAFVLPPDSEVHIERSADHAMEKISILNENVSVTISLAFSNMTVLQKGIHGILSEDATDPNRFESIVFTVDLQASTRFARKAFVGVDDYKRWFEHLSETLRFYSWASVESDMEKSTSSGQ